MSETKNTTPEKLKQFIERIERLNEEKGELLTDIREVFAEAKNFGLDPKIMRMIIKLRQMKSDARQEQEALLETYKQAVGME